MKSVIILTTFLLLFGVLIFAAPGTPTAGNIRINADTTNTNTESSRVTITQYTNFNSATVTATNWVQVGQSGEDGIITLTSSDTTNSVDITMDSAGQFRIETTTPDSEAGFVLNMTTPHTNGPSLQLQNNGNIIFSVNAQSGWTNSGLLFLSDRGLFESAGGGGAGITNIFDTVIITNATFISTNVNFTTNFYLNGIYITNIVQGINPTDTFLPVNNNGMLVDSALHETATNVLYQGDDVSGGYTLQFTDSNRAAFSTFGADSSHITINSGSGDVSLNMAPVGGSGNGLNFQPTVTDGAVPYVMSTLNSQTLTNLLEVQNHTNIVFGVMSIQGPTNTPLWLNINGTQNPVFLGPSDSGGTGFRQLIIAN